MPRLTKSPRRGYGDGSLEWIEAKQHYLARLRVGYTPEGKIKRLSKAFPIRQHRTKGDARRAGEAWLIEQRDKLSRGSLTPNYSYTLEVFTREYFARKKPDWKAKYHDDMEYLFEKYTFPELGPVNLTELTPMVVQRWLDGLRTSTTPHMRWKAWYYLSLILNQAVHLELIPRNPCKRAKVSKPPRGNLTRWTPDEVKAVLEHVHKTDHYLKSFVHVALTTGMRPSELFGLTWQRVNLEAGYLDVQEVVTYSHHSKINYDQRPKTPGSVRRVYLDGGTVKALRDQRARVEALRTSKAKWTGKKAWVERGLVFPSDTGGAMPVASFRKDWKAICTAAKVRYIPPKDTRSTWASLTSGKLLDHVAAARAGHGVTVREAHYVRTVDEQLKKAALSLEELLK